MSTDNKILTAITKLTELTQDRQLHWSKETNTGMITRGTEDIVDVAYQAHHLGKRLRVYELKFREYPDAPWDIIPVLEIIDEEGNPEWRFPPTPATRHLLESIRYQLSGADYFVKMLAEADEPFTEADVATVFSRIKYLDPKEILKVALECRRNLNFAGIATRGQLVKLVESKEIISWLEGAYTQELLRNPEAPLDPLAVAVWGGMLFTGGLTDDVKAKIIERLRKSPEYREKHMKSP